MYTLRSSGLTFEDIRFRQKKCKFVHFEHYKTKSGALDWKGQGNFLEAARLFGRLLYIFLVDYLVVCAEKANDFLRMICELSLVDENPDAGGQRGLLRS